MFQMPADQIGGAIVRRTIKTGGKQLMPGTHLSADQLLSFPTLNRMALIEKKYVEVYPKGSGDAPKGERFVMNAGFGRFFVIEGKKLTEEPLDREQAYALAGVTPPKQPARRKG